MTSLVQNVHEFASRAAGRISSTFSLHAKGQVYAMKHCMESVPKYVYFSNNLFLLYSFRVLTELEIVVLEGNIKYEGFCLCCRGSF